MENNIAVDKTYIKHACGCTVECPPAQVDNKVWQEAVAKSDCVDCQYEAYQEQYWI
jgi:hypothetical protein